MKYLRLIVVLFLVVITNRAYSNVIITATIGQAYGIRQTLDSAMHDISYGVYSGDIKIKIYGSHFLTNIAYLNCGKFVPSGANPNVSSIYISPMDTATVPITISTTFSQLFNSTYAKNITIDGRPNKTGNKNLLKFLSLNDTNSNGSGFISTDNFDSSFTCLNCDFECIGAYWYKCTSFFFLYQTSIYRNKFNVSNCNFKNISRGIFLEDCYYTIIKNNTFKNVLQAFKNGLAYGYINISNNNIYLDLSLKDSFANCFSDAISIYFGYSNCKIDIYNNRITNLLEKVQTTFSTNTFDSFGGIIIKNYSSSTGANPNDTLTVNIINNDINLLAPNDQINANWQNFGPHPFNGIECTYDQNCFVKYRVLNNTIRIGGFDNLSFKSLGSYLGAALIVGASEAYKNKYDIKVENNLLIYDRFINPIAHVSNPSSLWSNNSTAYFGPIGASNLIYDYNIHYNINSFYAYVDSLGTSVCLNDFNLYTKKFNYFETHSKYKYITFTDSINPYITSNLLNDPDLVGTPLVEVTTDIDGNPRDPRYPYKGASEPAPFQFHDLQVQAVINLNDSFINCKNQTLKLRILNNGNVGDSFSVNNPLQVNTKIIRPGGSIINLPTSTINSGMLNSGDSMDIILSNALNMDSVGLYSFTISINRTVDYNRSNDTLLFTRRVLNNEYGDSAVQAIQLSSTSNLKTQAGALSNQITKTFTIETWINPSTITAGNIITKDSTPFAIQLNAQGYVQFISKTQNGQQTLTSNTALTQNQWTHIAAVYDSSQMILYINGQLNNAITQSGSIAYNNGNTAITIGKTNTQNSVQAQLDELKIWNTARTIEQIRSGMHNRMANNTQANLLAYWRFDEPLNYYRFGDASGNCNTLYNATTNTISKNNCYIPLQTNIFSNQQIIQSSTNTIYTNTQFNQTDSNHSNIDTTLVYYLNRIPQQTQINNGYATQKQTWLYYNYGNGLQSQQVTTFNLSSTSFKNTAKLSDFALFRRGAAEGGAWTAIINGASSIDTINKTVSFSSPTAIPTASQLAIGIKYQSTPVTWLSFSGKAIGNDVQLIWQTAQEIHNRGFEIRQGTHAEYLQSIAFVSAKNQNQPNHYSWTDKNVLIDNQVHYYQLQQIDNDGQFSLSNIIAIHPTQIASENPIIVYPNPFNESLIIETNSNELQHVQIIGMDGKVYLEQAISKQALLNTASLPDGLYVLKCVECNAAIKVMKMEVR